ncbi:MAG: hypothetical protein AAB874_03305 [Patescibacteria group bacterium]
MHPNKIPSENPSEDKEVDGTEHYTTEADPCKAGQSFKNGVMKLYSGR